MTISRERLDALMNSIANAGKVTEMSRAGKAVERPEAKQDDAVEAWLMSRCREPIAPLSPSARATIPSLSDVPETQAEG